MILKLDINRKITLGVPSRTKIITNNEFITLAYKQSKNVICTFTCPVENIQDHEWQNENNWTQLDKWELQDMLKLLK